MPDRRSLAIVLLAWLGLCVPGLLYGLPQLLNPDEITFVNGAYRILRPPYGDPEWYGAPASILMDLLALVYGVVFLAGKVFGTFDSAFLDFTQRPEKYVLLGRVVTAAGLLAAGLAMLAYARSFLSPVPALVSALVLVLAPAVLDHAQIVRMDVFLILFLVLVLHFSNLIASRAEPRHFVLAGVALGAAVTSKYPGILAVVPILAAAVLAWRRGTVSVRRGTGCLVTCALASLATAFLLGPYLFINMGEMLADVAREARAVHLSATSPGFGAGLVFYLLTAVPAVTGTLPAIVGAAGLLIGMFSRARPEVIPAAVFGACFLLFISALSLQWIRWGLPLAVPIAVGVGVAVERLSEDAGRWRRIAVVATIIALAATLIGVSGKATYLKAANRDTRIAAAEWIERNVPKGASIAVETYAPQLSVDDYEVMVPRDGALTPLGDAWPYRKRPPPFFGSFGSMWSDSGVVDAASIGIDYIIISNWEDRYQQEIERYRMQYAVYQRIRSSFIEIRSFAPGSWQLGPRITVFRVAG